MMKIKDVEIRKTRSLMALAGLLMAISGAFGAFAATPQEAVDAFASTARLPKSSMAVLISDLHSGKVIGSYNSDLPLIPASIMKCVTIATLSNLTDVDAPLETIVSIDGKTDRDGMLHGNVIIDACGDPSLNSTVWPESPDIIAEIVAALKKEGITGIAGRIIIDESFFAGVSVPPTWAAGDLPHSYGTGSHTFNYSNNASGKRSVNNPAAVFTADLKRALAAAGIDYSAGELPEGKQRELVRHQSAELKEIMRSCMMRSDNLFAETLLRRAGKERGGDGSTEDAAKREMEYWKRKGCDMAGVKILDGSGLSRSNRLTARFMENVLKAKAEDVEYASFLPLAGQEGTLRRFLADTPLDSYIALKTGSMSGIQCYAGYKLDDDFAPTHVVVVIVNDFRCDRSYLRQQIEKMLLEVFGS